MLTQKYKQQQQQVRVQTSESNYAKGMFFSDVPLTEGYSKILVNWDIDENTGKIVPRKGLRSEHSGANYDKTIQEQYNYFSEGSLAGYNNITHAKVAYTPATPSAAQANIDTVQRLLATVYNTNSQDYLIFNNGVPTALNPKITDTLKHGVRPYVLREPSIHGKKCFTNTAFKKPVGVFGENNNYYYFLNTPITARYTHMARIPASQYPGIGQLSHLPEYGNPGEYFTGVYVLYGGGDINYDQPAQRDDDVVYYNSEGVRTRYYPSSDYPVDPWTDLESLEEGVYPSYEAAFLAENPLKYIGGVGELCYTKFGRDIQPDDVLLDTSVNRANIADDTIYVCKVTPQKLNPSEAASWGYNMLLEKPYDFVCEKTASNTITILGMLPYDSSGQVCLTPRKNQEITLKAYYRAPEAFHSQIKNGTFYATTKQWLGEGKEKHNPTTVDELPSDLTDYRFGDWWYVEGTKEYYMIMPGADLTEKRLELFGTSKPAASVQLTPTIDTEAENKVRVHWQIRTVNSSSWVDVYNNEVELTAEQEPFTVTTTMSSEEVLVKLTISDPLDIDDLGQEYVLTTNTIGLSLVSDDLANNLNLNPIKYDLSTCAGMCNWQQRLVLWGVQGAFNTVFVSDVNNPTFFPYPNNIDTFSDTIRAVYPLGEELLVLTATALYRLAWNSDGLGWTRTLVQQNLHIRQEDAHMCCTIKNMFFFKSGEYYYMMVPKSTASGVRGENTTIAPVSNSINALLDNFHNEVYDLVKLMTDQSDLFNFTEQLIHYGVSATNDSVYITYTYDLVDAGYDPPVNTPPNHFNSCYLNIQLIYNINTRAWNMRVFETPYMLLPLTYKDLVTQTYLTLMYTIFENDPTAVPVLGLDQLSFSGEARNSNPYISDNVIRYWTKQIYPTLYRTFYTPTLNNYQYLDTGNRDINTDMKKRFREFQFKIRNVNATSLGMHTSFLIDGSLRRDLQKFSPRYITDESTGEAVIVIERTLDNNPNYLSFVPEYKITRVDRVIVPENMLQDSGELTPTTLAESTDPDYWVIDQSAFPGRTFWKIRVAISGKGYTPRAQLLSTNLKHFEVLGHNWVYRTMHGR